MPERELFIDPEKLSPAACEVWAFLSESARRDIQRDCPFKGVRDDLLMELRKKGVEIPLLVEISGVSSSAISRLTKGIRPASFRPEADFLHDPEIKQLAKEILAEALEFLKLSNAISKANSGLLAEGSQK